MSGTATDKLRPLLLEMSARALRTLLLATFVLAAAWNELTERDFLLLTASAAVAATYEALHRGWRPRLAGVSVPLVRDPDVLPARPATRRIVVKGAAGALIIVLVLGVAELLGTRGPVGGVAAGLLLAGFAVRSLRAGYVWRWQRRHRILLLRADEGPGYGVERLVAEAADAPAATDDAR